MDIVLILINIDIVLCYILLHKYGIVQRAESIAKSIISLQSNCQITRTFFCAAVPVCFRFSGCLLDGTIVAPPQRRS